MTPNSFTVETSGTPDSTKVTVNGQPFTVTQISSSLKTSYDGTQVINVVAWGNPGEKP